MYLPYVNERQLPLWVLSGLYNDDEEEGSMAGYEIYEEKL